MILKSAQKWLQMDLKLVKNDIEISTKVASNGPEMDPKYKSELHECVK